MKFITCLKMKPIVVLILSLLLPATTFPASVEKPADTPPLKPNLTAGDRTLAESGKHPGNAGQGENIAKLRNFTDPATQMEFVAVKGGCFPMGDSYGDGFILEGGTNIEKPVHEVCVSPFLMGKYEVTVEQFAKFVAETGYKTEAELNSDGLSGCYSFEFDKKPLFEYRDWSNWKQPNRYLKNKDNHPVTCVSWNDSQAFISWLKSKSAVDYRLPTEAEWEYAARGGTTTRNYWGDGKDIACRYANVADRAKLDGGLSWPGRHDCEDGYPYVAPVGQFKANGFGLYDMMGNVWEWTNDRFEPTYYQSANNRDNPEGPGTGASRIYRGGSFVSGLSDVRASFRPNLQLGRRYYDVGFRLVIPVR